MSKGSKPHSCNYLHLSIILKFNVEHHHMRVQTEQSNRSKSHSCSFPNLSCGSKIHHILPSFTFIAVCNSIPNQAHNVTLQKYLRHPSLVFFFCNPSVLP